MVLYFTTAVFLLVAAAIIAYCRWAFTGSKRKTDLIDKGQYTPVSLFEPAHVNDVASAAQKERESATIELLNRSTPGNFSVLRDAKTLGGDPLYEQSLNRLISDSRSDRQLFALVSHVARDEQLRVTVPLAARFLDSWKQSKERVTVAEVLHVSALSDNPQLYQLACETALDEFRAGNLSGLSAADLLTLIEGEFWILSQQARASGAGFVLKQSIRGFRKQLTSKLNQS